MISKLQRINFIQLRPRLINKDHFFRWRKNICRNRSKDISRDQIIWKLKVEKFEQQT
jgi:hypothetical protein